ncbi:MAG TPA: GNAT family N-acetyltransferase [Bosea sp. (in: a-proteobacteria)]
MTASLMTLPSTVVWRDITLADAPACAALSRAVGWPHRAEDCAMAIALGHGSIATVGDEVAAVGMWWPYGESHATVGMIIVSPDHQGAGIGGRLVQGLLAQAKDRSLMLNATAAGQPLYERLGFVACGGISQHHGEVLDVAAPELAAGAALRAATPADAPEIGRLDQAASGLPRGPLLASLLERGECVILERAGRAVGFSVLRRFGRGLVVGPVVAESDGDAQALMAHWLHGRRGQFMRIDIHTGSPLAGWLTQHGLKPAGDVVAMVRGALPVVHGPLRLHALANQALG